MHHTQEKIQKFDKSASHIKKQIEFRFLKQSGEKMDNLESFQFLTLFDSFPSQVQDKVHETIRLNEYELPVILNYINKKNFVLFTTERIHFNKGLINKKVIPLKEIKHGFFKFHNRMFQGLKDGESKPMTPNQNKNAAKIKSEGHFLDFELEFHNLKSIVFKIPTGSAAYALINTLNVLRIAGTKYDIIEYKKAGNTVYSK